ncbi:trypsin-like peptidase domain-containing protein [Candidatus Uabimicrobium sp. HlEnr_7]|uniref:trypsin-like peptidase domain-containing protein n=1 Tax=Candidatus Uabimicrobium helgolandensis TaxID=3095367 RepID=UPI003556E9B4
MSEKIFFCTQCAQEQKCTVDPFNGKISCTVCNEHVGHDNSHGPVAKSGNENIAFGEPSQAPFKENQEKKPLVIDVGQKNSHEENPIQSYDDQDSQIFADSALQTPNFHSSIDVAYDKSKGSPFLFFLTIFFLSTLVSVFGIVYFVQKATQKSPAKIPKAERKKTSPLEQIKFLENLRVERTQKVKKSIVIIESTTSTYLNSFKQGTGFILDEIGHVATNHHVISQNLGKITGILHNGRRINFLLHSYDEISDLAILKIMDFEKIKTEVQTITWGDSKAVKTGNHIWTLAHPRGLYFSLINGFVSHHSRYLATYLPKKDYPNGGYFHSWIQVDAVITEGVSGGPLFNLDGKVIGVNTRRSEYSGLGFCIPSDYVQEIISELLNFKQVIRNTLGIVWRPNWHIKQNQGAVVGLTIPYSTAEKAGLKPGDVIYEINGKPVTCRQHHDLPSLRKRESELSSDQQTIVKFKRKDMIYEIRLFPELRKPFYDKIIFFRELKLWGIPISPSLQAYLKTPQKVGIWIIDIHHSSPFFKAGLAKNDLLLGINNPFKSSSDFLEIYNKLPRKQRIHLIVQTGQQIRKLRFWTK